MRMRFKSSFSFFSPTSFLPEKVFFMLINKLRYKIYLFLQGLQHLPKIPPMETFDEKQLLKAISEGDEEALKLSSYTITPASKGLSTDYCNRRKRPKTYHRTSFLHCGTTAHPSIPSTTLKPIFSVFAKMQYTVTSNVPCCSRTISKKKLKSFPHPRRATKSMTTSTLKNSNCW